MAKVDSKDGDLISIKFVDKSIVLSNTWKSFKEKRRNYNTIISTTDDKSIKKHRMIDLDVDPYYDNNTRLLCCKMIKSNDLEIVHYLATILFQNEDIIIRMFDSIRGSKFDDAIGIELENIIDTIINRQTCLRLIFLCSSALNNRWNSLIDPFSNGILCYYIDELPVEAIQIIQLLIVRKFFKVKRKMDSITNNFIYDSFTYDYLLTKTYDVYKVLLFFVDAIIVGCKIRDYNPDEILHTIKKITDFVRITMTKSNAINGEMDNFLNLVSSIYKFRVNPEE